MSSLICKIFKKIPKNIACDFGSLFSVGLICSGFVGLCLVVVFLVCVSWFLGMLCVMKIRFLVVVMDDAWVIVCGGAWLFFKTINLTAIFFGSFGAVLWLSEKDSNFKPERDRERRRAWEEWRRGGASDGTCVIGRRCAKMGVGGYSQVKNRRRRKKKIKWKKGAGLVEEPKTQHFSF